MDASRSLSGNAELESTSRSTSMDMAMPAAAAADPDELNDISEALRKEIMDNIAQGIVESTSSEESGQTDELRRQQLSHGTAPASKGDATKNSKENSENNDDGNGLVEPEGVQM